jgi:hypothetical protein
MAEIYDASTGTYQPESVATKGVFWIGDNGQVYVKGDQGTNAAGSADANTQKYWTSQGYDMISDPNPTIGGQGYSATTTNNITPTSNTSEPAKVFNQAGADNTQKTIDQIAPLLQAALESENTRRTNTVNGFNAAEATQRKTYGDSTVTNQQNYDSNFMGSILAGIHGLSGLMALLRGTGASGGTAEDMARDTVGGVTANDIRGGADTQKENQGQLDSSINTFLTDLKQKRTAADDTYENNQRAIRRDSNSQLQSLYGNMAGFFGDVGNTAESNNWMNKAGALTPEIAANSKTQVSPYDTTPVVVHAPNLTAFAPPTQPSVTTAPDGQVGSGIFTMTDPRRRKDATVGPSPVGV